MQIPADIREMYLKAECIYTKQQVESALDDMAYAIQKRLSHSNPILLGVMVGCMVPLGNLLPRLDFPLSVDYVHASRYGGEQQGSDLVWRVEPTLPLKDRVVLVVDDILDEGITLTKVVEYCVKNGAEQVLTAVLVDKQHARAAQAIQQADFTALTVEDRFVFGYGMDYQEYLRNAPGIFAID